MTSNQTPAGSEVRAEYLAPAELDAAIAAAPIVYLPLGTLEFHSSHAPIGLDALTAQGLCTRAARQTGGIVLPVVYQGFGGGHGGYPWTIMMADGAGIRSHLEQTLQRLEDFGARVAVIFSGHFAPEQLDLIDELASDWNAQSRPLRVVATAINRNDAAPLAPDHAGAFESSVLHSLHPELLHLDRLPAADAHPANDPDGDPHGLHRHNEDHPLWGIFGPDPRGIDLESTGEVRDHMVAWLRDLATAQLTATSSAT